MFFKEKFLKWVKDERVEILDSLVGLDLAKGDKAFYHSYVNGRRESQEVEILGFYRIEGYNKHKKHIKWDNIYCVFIEGLYLPIQPKSLVKIGSSKLKSPQTTFDF